jgi:iron(III) transport system substrate-binding protein
MTLAPFLFMSSLPWDKLRAGVTRFPIALLLFSAISDLAFGAEQVVVYRSVKDSVARSVAERFEKETGISVRLVPETAETDVEELTNGLTAEKSRSQPDVLWTDNPLRAVAMKSKGLSVPYKPPNIISLWKPYSDSEHHWTGFPARALIILFNKNVFSDPEEVPTSVLDMINPRFNGKACLSTPLFGTTSLYAAALFEVLGTDFAEAFFNSLKTNAVAILSSTDEVRCRVAAGDFSFGIARTDDFDTAVKAGKPVGGIFPDQKTFGTLVVPDALVLLANAPNPEQGKKFIDFVLRPEIQKILATGDAGPACEAIPSLNGIKSMEVDYDKLVSKSKELTQGFLKEWTTKGR